jgi:hypothetical protein
MVVRELMAIGTMLVLKIRLQLFVKHGVFDNRL